MILVFLGGADSPGNEGISGVKVASYIGQAPVSSVGQGYRLRVKVNFMA